MNETAKVLLVEDNSSLGFIIQDLLKLEGYKVHLASDGSEGLMQFNKERYDICLLDVMMPKKDGFSLAKDIRKINSEVPIVFLTAKGMTEDRIEGFKAGADDYITKPFSNEELLLRLKAILKRNKSSDDIANENKEFTLGAFTFNQDTFVLARNGEDKRLTKKEAELLSLLCAHKNKILERSLVANLIWGEDNYFVGRSMDVFITRLRKYLKADSNVKITNVHGVGFTLEVKN